MAYIPAPTTRQDNSDGVTPDSPTELSPITHNSNLLSSPSPLPVLPAITSQINHWPSSPYHRVCVWGELNLIHGHSWPFLHFSLAISPFKLQLYWTFYIYFSKGHMVSHTLFSCRYCLLYGISPINSMFCTQKTLTCSSKCNSVSTFPPNHCHPPPSMEGSLLCSYAIKYLQICFLIQYGLPQVLLQSYTHPPPNQQPWHDAYCLL